MRWKFHGRPCLSAERAIIELVMDAGVIDPNPSELMVAVEENLHGHVSFVQRQLPGMLVQHDDDLIMVDSGLASDTFNKILGSRLSRTAADERIQRALAHFRNNSRPFTWWVGPCSRPLNLESRLREHGLHAQEYELGMTLALSRIGTRADVSADVVIKPVTNERQLTDFSQLLASLFDPPDQAVATFFDHPGVRKVLFDESPGSEPHVPHSQGI